MKDIQLSTGGKKVNPSVILLAVTGLIFVIYMIAGFSPLLKSVKTNLADKNRANQSIAQLNDAMSENLEEKVSQAQTDLKEFNQGTFIDENLVYDDIGKGASQTGVTITNVSFSSSSTSGKFEVHPISVSASGSNAALLQFIKYFETNQVGAYAVGNVSLSSGSLTMTLTLYTPG